MVVCLLSASYQGFINTLKENTLSDIMQRFGVGAGISDSGLRKVRSGFSSWKEMEVGVLGQGPPVAVRKSLQCSWLITASRIRTYLLMKHLFISLIPSRNHHTHPLIRATECHKTTPKLGSFAGLISNTVMCLGAQVQQRCAVGWQFVMAISCSNLTGFKVLWEF